MSLMLPHWLSTLMAFILALGILVLFHELGHYAAARMVGVRVLRFSVGFGPSLLRWKAGIQQTEWVVAAIPLGGYVRMLDEREGPVPASMQHEAFNRQSLGARTLIVLAGPLANLVLSWLLFSFLYTMGVPGERACLGTPLSGSPAAQAGVHDGDCVTALNAMPVTTWSSLELAWADQRGDGSGVTLQALDQGGHSVMRHLSVDHKNFSATEGVAELGLKHWNPRLPAVVGQVIPGGVAAQVGIREGDRVMAVNGHAVNEWPDLVRQIEPRAQQATAVLLLRGGQTLSLTLVPKAVQQDDGRVIGRIGVSPEISQNLRQRMTVLEQDSPRRALGHGAEKLMQLSRLSLVSRGQMITGRGSWDDLGGPVRIASLAGETARLGFIPYVQFLALVSLSLGILNLMPIPLLDGGHLLYHALEYLRGGPLSAKTMAWAQQFGLLLLVGMMSLSLYNDLRHFINH